MAASHSLGKVKADRIVRTTSHITASLADQAVKKVVRVARNWVDQAATCISCITTAVRRAALVVDSSSVVA